MPSVVFADIDGTLVESIRRVGHLGDTVVGARDREGNPVAVRGPRQLALWRFLSSADAVIPVTGRSIDALRRVELPFVSYAIAHHGAALLNHERVRLPEYEAVVRVDRHSAHAALSAEFDRTSRWIATNAPGLRIYRQVLDESTIEVCVKDRSPTASSVGAAGDVIEESWRAVTGARIHRNGNNLALLPAAVTKEGAVAWLSARLEAELGPITTFGVGDSDSDLGFMRACDYWLVPQRSQLGDWLLRGAHAG